MTVNEAGCACGFPDCMKLITDRETIRNSDDPDVDRIVRRVGAALNSGHDAAVVDVVLDETQAARDEADTLRTQLAAIEALPAQWIASTADGLGRRIDHWRGPDYAEGFDAGIESCADVLRAVLSRP